MTINRELFEAWLFSQPREREFVYTDNRNCLICSFLKSNTRFQNPNVSHSHLYLDNCKSEPIPSWLFETISNSNYNEVYNGYKVGKPVKDGRRTFAYVQDSYLQLFPNTLDGLSNQSQTEGVTVSPQQERETPVNSPLKTQ